MTGPRPPRDHNLLDAIDALERAPFEGHVWRVVREGHDPTLGHLSAGRWDPGTFDVLYTSCTSDGALAEIHFHLSRQPVFPSKIRYDLHELEVQARNTLRFADMRELATVGIDEAAYSEILYARTQEVGDAAYFLGFDGIIAPSARWSCLNAVLFTDRVAVDGIKPVKATHVDWGKWRARMNADRRESR